MQHACVRSGGSERSIGRAWIRGLLLALAAWIAGDLAAAAPTPLVWVVELDGAITPATASFVHDAIRRASTAKVALVVLRMDTPGGLDTAMRDIIRDVLASSIPIATFVAPNGARAASAGTYILYASHVAAMSPGTTLGAATPVRIGVAPPDISPTPQGGSKPPGTAEDALAAKQVNDAAAYIRSLAQLRHRNGEWAELAVREAASLSASEALQAKVVDIVADDIADLLRQTDGLVVHVGATETRIATAGARVESIEPDWRTHVLSIIANPNVALILMMLGTYGLLFELMYPGTSVPGVIGAICLILAFFGFQYLPVNYAGFALLILGVALIVAEAFLPSFGVIGVGGIVAFVFGGVLLFDRETPGVELSLGLVVGLAVTSAAVLIWLVGMAARARRRPVVSGRDTLIGAEGELIEVNGSQGYAEIQGERWRVASDAPLSPGERIRVVAVDGLTAHVRRST